MSVVGKVLYKRTATGAVQVWYQELNDTGDGYRTVSGQIDGEKVTSAWTICEAKNVGRANETTPQQQALNEVESNYTKKLAQGGYHETIETIDKAKYFKPMLAEGYDEYPVDGIAFRRGIIYSQPKLDGMRCVIDAEGMWSRNGKPILSAPHIYESLKPFFERNPFVILDGELFADKLKDNFEKIMSLARKTKNITEKDIEESERYLQYWMYDYPTQPGPFSERYKVLTEVFAENSEFDRYCRLVPTEQVRDQEHLDALNADYLEQGQEGQMIRIDGEHYQNKRTKQLLKRKEFQDDEFPIVRIEEGIGNRSGMAGRIVCQLPDGREFGAGIKGSHPYCVELLKEADQYVGGEATVKFLRYSTAGIPNLPVCIQVFKGKRDV